MSLLGKVLPMTTADTEQNGETRFVVTSRVVWPADKDGIIAKPSWWGDEEKGDAREADPARRRERRRPPMQ